MQLLIVANLPFYRYIITMSDLFNQTQNTSSSGVAEDISFELPPEKRVVFFNDDFTTMDFVVDVLVSIFNKSHDDAELIMQTVHQKGSAVVGIYTYDIAVSRTNLTKAIAKKKGFPLRVEIE